MVNRMSAAACLLAVALPAVAQHAGTSASPAQRPASGASPVRPASPPSATAASSPGTSASPYRSAFEGYRGMSDEPVVGWKEANDRVRQIGGWRAYAQEAAGDGQGAHAGHGNAATPAATSASGAGHHPPRAGQSHTERPFGQTETTAPARTAPRPTPAAPAASVPAPPAFRHRHH